MRTQESIIEVIRSRGLSESDIDAIVAIVGERCRYKTKARLRSIQTSKHPSNRRNNARGTSYK